MDEERVRLLVLTAGQHLRREFPLDASGLTPAMIEKLEQMRQADQASVDKSAAGKREERT